MNGNFISIPVGIATYIVVKDKTVLRSAIVCGAREAREVLKPQDGEELYLKVGSARSCVLTSRKVS